MKTSYKGPIFTIICIVLVYIFRSSIGGGIDSFFHYLARPPQGSPQESYASTHLPQTVEVNGETVHPQISLDAGDISFSHGVKLKGQTGLEAHWRDRENFASLRVISNVCSAPPYSAAGVHALSVRAYWDDNLGCYQVSVNENTDRHCWDPGSASNPSCR
jgi:hypothetical protein